MKRKCRITSLPKAQEGMNFKSSNLNSQRTLDVNKVDSESTSGINVRKTLNAVPREAANLEAEHGETVVTDLSKNGIPELYKIGGNRHHSGGTPLNLPNDSFIFSRDKSLKIKDPEILAQFGKTITKKGKGKSAYTPAELSKQYDLNKYQKILLNPDSTKREIKTAEMMIENYNNKLGALALVQESMKGFPDGIPIIAMPYLQTAGIDPKELIQIPAQEERQEMPEAKYGGESNVYFQNGGQTNRRKVRVMLPKMQFGSVPPPWIDPKYWRQLSPQDQKYIVENYSPEGVFIGNKPVDSKETSSSNLSNKATNKQNIPDNANKWDETAEGYDESKIKPNDYVKRADGKWYKVNGYKTKNYNYEDPRLGELQQAYGHLQNTVMNDPNLQEVIFTNYKKHIQDSKLSDKEKERLLNLDRKDVIKNFLEGQKQVYAINNSGVLYEKDDNGNIIYENGKPKMKSEKELKKWETSNSDEYRKVMKDLGFSEDELLSGDKTAAFQAAYRGLQDASGDEKFSEKLKNFNLTPIGVKDAHGKHTYKDKPISPVDKMFGNTTAGQAVLPKELDKELDMSKVEETKTEQPKEYQHLAEPEAEPPTPFWLQDIIRTTGAAGDFYRVKKHSPWQATPGTYLPDPTFMDPTRQLAANAELANIATQGVAAFSGPQAFNARSAQIQGQAAQNVANTLASVHNQNVNIANQFEQTRSGIMNNASNRNAQLATNLFDKNTIANQQFENEKNLARQNLRQSYIDAITNRAQTQTMNSLYPQYNVDPLSGGYTYFTKGSEIKPQQSNGKGIMDRIANYKELYPGWDDNTYLQAAKAESGIPEVSSNQHLGMNPAMFAYPGGYNSQGK